MTLVLVEPSKVGYQTVQCGLIVQGRCTRMPRMGAMGYAHMHIEEESEMGQSWADYRKNENSTK